MLHANMSTQTRVTVADQKSPNSSRPNNTTCTRFPGVETVRKGLAQGLLCPDPVLSTLRRRRLGSEAGAGAEGVESPQGRVRSDKNPTSEGKPMQGTESSSRQTVTRDISYPPQKRMDTLGK